MLRQLPPGGLLVASFWDHIDDRRMQKAIAGFG
jgi:hypothetical protein